MASADRVVVDLGTGDGRAVLGRAGSEPGSLVIGIDANAASMAEASRRAARRGPANTLFVVAAAERIPPELHGVADELTVMFPWGSLLRGVLALDEATMAADGIASLLAPSGTATAILSIEDRDGLDLPRLDTPDACEALRDRLSAHGLEVSDLRPATAKEITATGSTWAKRLGAGRDRAVWRLELHGTREPRTDGLGTRR